MESIFYVMVHEPGGGVPRLARARGVAKLEQLLRQMDDDGVRPDATLLNTLLGGYARTLQYER